MAGSDESKALERVALQFEKENGWIPVLHHIGTAAGLSQGSGYAQQPSLLQDAHILSRSELKTFLGYAKKNGISNDTIWKSEYHNAAALFLKR